jgi:hypothetical protein
MELKEERKWIQGPKRLTTDKKHRFLILNAKSLESDSSYVR